MSPDVVIAAMTSEELSRAIDWAAAEGWDPGISDAGCFRSAAPEGFLAARIDDRMIGSISSVQYGPSFGFIGMFIVVPELRGRGIGSQLWTAGMDRQSGRITGLDGVVAMQDSYARSGFVLAHRNLRYSGTLALVPRDDSGVVILGPENLDEVVAYDEPCFGAARPAFLSAWLAQAASLTVGVRDRGGLTGYGTVRPSRDGFKIGPLLADDDDTAWRLLAAMRAHVGDDVAVSLDVPEPHAAAVAIAEGLGMSVSFETARMYVGGRPAIVQERVFSITTYELG